MDNNIKLIENKGKFIKPCPGTPKHVCCGYMIIDFAHGCNLGCKYCILNYYFRDKPLEYFININDMILEVNTYLNSNNRLVRFGTGEFTDSLLFEKEYPIYDRLIPIISKRKNAVLEIKTKTINIEPLLKIKERNNIIVSWSLNTDKIAREEEVFAPSVEERINAAKLVQNEGYKLSFHFDPLVYYKGWKEDYKIVIERLFKAIRPESIVYISMGTLRFMSFLKDIIRKSSRIYSYGEFVTGIDGKYRYFRPLRTEMYITVKKYLTEWVDEEKIYMCMESEDVWYDVFSVENMNTKLLSRRLDKACRRHFDLI